MPRWVFLLTMVLVAASWIPFAFIARARHSKHDYTRIQIFPDMDQQPRFDPQAVNRLFQDGRAARRQVEGTVASDEIIGEDHLVRGWVDGRWAEAFPIPVTEKLMRRGRREFNIYCAPCHGLGGAGDGAVARRAEALEEGTWTPPSSLHDPNVRGRPVGHIFNTITHGIRNMPPHGAQIGIEDRWAIVAYVRALQRSQNATIEDVPAELRPLMR